jgi:hypothetical protein
MPDIATIGTVLSSVKTVTDLAKIIKNSELSLSDAETKLQIAEMISALADVKLELADVQQQLIDRDVKIKELEESLKDKKALSYDGQLYRHDDDPVPFCPVCIEKEDKQYHLTYMPQDEWTSANHYCRVCENSYYE